MVNIANIIRYMEQNLYSISVRPGNIGTLLEYISKDFLLFRVSFRELDQYFLPLNFKNRRNFSGRFFSHTYYR